MTSSEVIESMAIASYARGVPVLSFAESIATVLIEEAFGLDCGHPRAVLAARQVVGAILDGGWHPPAVRRTG